MSKMLPISFTATPEEKKAWEELALREGRSLSNWIKRQLETQVLFYGKDAAAVSLGRKGGLKGGNARAKALSSERKSEIAKTAANKRWGKI